MPPFLLPGTPAVVSTTPANAYATFPSGSRRTVSSRFTPVASSTGFPALGPRADRRPIEFTDRSTPGNGRPVVGNDPSVEDDFRRDRVPTVCRTTVLANSRKSASIGDRGYLRAWTGRWEACAAQPSAIRTCAKVRPTGNYPPAPIGGTRSGMKIEVALSDRAKWSVERRDVGRSGVRKSVYENVYFAAAGDAERLMDLP